MLSPLSAILLAGISTSFFTTFASIKLVMLGVPQWIIGMMGSLYYSGMLAGSHTTTRFILRVGHIRGYVFFSTFILLSELSQYFSDATLSWAVSRFLMGLGIGALYLVIESWLVNDAPAAKKGSILSIYTIALYLGSLFGQGLFEFVDVESATAYIVPALFIGISLFPIASTHTRYPVYDSEETMKITKVLSVAPVESFNVLVAGILLSTFYVMLPVFLYQSGFDPKDLSLLSMIYLGAICLQYPFGRLSDYIQRRKILILLYFLTIIVMMIMMIWSTSLLGEAVSLFLLGGLTFSIYPIAMAYTCDPFDPKDYFVVVQTVLLVYGTGAIMGPIVASYCMEIFGARALFGFLSAMCCICSIFTYLYRYYPYVKTETKVEFISPQTTTKLATDTSDKKRD